MSRAWLSVQPPTDAAGGEQIEMALESWAGGVQSGVVHLLDDIRAAASDQKGWAHVHEWSNACRAQLT